MNPGQMVKLVDDLREEFDYVLLDCPAGIEQGFQNAIAGADRALVVTTPEVSAIRDVYKRQVLKDSDLKDGDKIVTSNTSSVFVPGILVGYAAEITNDTNNVTKSGYLIPAAEFDSLQEVLVITDLKVKMTEETTAEDGASAETQAGESETNEDGETAASSEEETAAAQ